MPNTVSKLDWKRINVLVDLALDEDMGGVGDATSISVIGSGVKARAALVCREQCVCAGLPVAEAVFRKTDPEVEFASLVQDGELCPPGAALVKIAGDAAAMLAAERTALNFLQRLCGIATVSRRYAEALRGTGTIVLDTRKTTPGWRNLEKYAVAVGGAANHRIGLYDRIMIKDNHRELAGLLSSPGKGVAEAVAKARKMFPDLEVEVEADTLGDVRAALEAGADHILLDNMGDETMKEAVRIAHGRARLEASGGITYERLAKIAETGVDFISCGALTHSVRAIDISMEICAAE